jgi:hypothetical protein
MGNLFYGNSENIQEIVHIENPKKTEREKYKIERTHLENMLYSEFIEEENHTTLFYLNELIISNIERRASHLIVIRFKYLSSTFLFHGREQTKNSNKFRIGDRVDIEYIHDKTNDKVSHLRKMEYSIVNNKKND